jgi:hypothetical protein
LSYQGVFENLLRVGSIESIDYPAQKCRVRMYDRVDDRDLDVALHHPSAGIDTGVFHCPEVGTLVLIGWGFRETPFVVTTLPNASFVQDLTRATNTNNLLSAASGYPSLRQGEVAISGVLGTEIKITDFGCIDFRFGLSSLQLDSTDQVILKTINHSLVTDAGNNWEGKVLRDLRLQTTFDEESENKLFSLSSFRLLSEISREPFFTPVTLSSGLTRGFSEEIRNPAFVERKSILKEFGDSFRVGTFDEEVERLVEEDNFEFLFDFNQRDQARYDVLNLNPDFPNTLIEKVEGTLIDIYGNLMDINRNIIQFPDDQEGRKQGKTRLSQLDARTRRSIKLHYEINSRKDSKGEVSLTTLDGPDLLVGHNLSRWSIDVDGEGLTKINIPASSNVGNIPLLARYVTAHQNAKRKDLNFRAGSTDQDPGEGTNSEGDSNVEKGAVQDILHLGFGKAGVTTLPETYLPVDLGGTGKLKYKTAYHDIVNTAARSLEAVAIQNQINNEIPEIPGQGSGNAGGRSLFANLDGSLELNIGRDVVDHKSIVLDTSGGIISRIGKTSNASNSASIISQLDGSIYVQVGGDKVEGDSDLNEPKVRFVVKGTKGISEITIDENSLRVNGGNDKDVILHSQKDLILSAKGKAYIMSKTIAVGGAANPETGELIEGPFSTIPLKGKEQ